MVQELVSKLYKQFVKLAFNITIIVLIIGLFVGMALSDNSCKGGIPSFVC